MEVIEAFTILSDNMNKILEGIKAVFMDLDGTLYLGDKPIDGVNDFLSRLTERGIKKFYLSNNSSRSKKDYIKKLADFDINAIESEILLSTDDLLGWLKNNDFSRTYTIGTKSMCSMLEEHGIQTSSDKPEIIVLGYDTEINYDKLTKSSIFLHKGIPLVASHPDTVCPSPEGGLPDVGAYLALIEATTGVRPVHICGKPNPGMLLHKISELGLQPNQVAMIGDRLYTDIEMANRVGCLSVLVLTGEATKEDAMLAEQKVDIIVNSVSELAI
ncbi:MAG: HAD family hydrolase [Methanobacteriota archaeon]|nr:MAG: HAD family hydrolase [Euryarchaeota archaeon]